MSEDLLRQPFDPIVKGAFGARLGAHRRAKGQQPSEVASTQSGLGSHARRLNAWCVITKESTGASIAMRGDGFESRYPESIKRKPINPSLKKVTINRVTTYAWRVNLTIELLVEFEVYTFDMFQKYAREFLRRPEDGSPLTVRFGHVPLDSQGRGIGECVIRDVWVIGGGYKQEGSKWSCSFKAIAPASAALIVDMSESTVGIPKGLFFQALNNKSRTLQVGSLHELILHFLQTNGSRLTEQLADGEEVGGSVGPVAASSVFTNPIGKVYKPFKGAPLAEQSAWAGYGPSTEGVLQGVDTGAVEYVSLLFLVELVNKFVLDPVNKRQNGLELKIELLPDSKSYVPGRYFKSAYPVDVLFLSGKKGGAGTYQADGDENAGKDFEVGGKYFGGCIKDYTCYHNKILISRKAAIQPLLDAHKKIEEQRAKDQKAGKTTNLDAFEAKIITVGSYFDELFRMIQTASGSYVNLCFTHIKDAYKGGKKTHILRIDNCSYVSAGKSDVHTLYPITGDGNTLSVDITGKLPDSMVGLAIISSGGQGSDTSTATADVENNDVRKEQLDKVLRSLISTKVDSDPPGVFAKIAESNFAPPDMKAASDALQSAKNLAKPSGWNNGEGWTEFFEIEMSATMEGAFPIIVGNRFTAEGLPEFVSLSRDLCFVALDVIDTIEAPGIWTTEIKTKLCHV